MSKQDAIRNAVAIVEMEGYTITEENLALIQQCIDGELTIKEVIDIVRERAKERVIEKQKSEEGDET